MGRNKFPNVFCISGSVFLKARGFCFGRRAQIGVEYLSLTAFILIAVGIFFAFSLVYFAEVNSNNLSKNATDSLAASANQMASFGSGSSSVVTVDLPDGVQSLDVNYGNEITLVVSTPSGNKVYWSAVDANITPPIVLAKNSGKHLVRVSFVDGNILFQELTG